MNRAAAIEMRLSTLLAGIAAVPAKDDRVVNDLTLDSRAATAGSCFVALSGREHNGLDYLAQAVAAGAVAVIAEQPPAHPSGVPVIVVPALAGHLGTLATRLFDAPSQSIALHAVTGTNGKTTVCWILAAMLRQLHGSCGYIGTLGAGLTPPYVPLPNTTPDILTTSRQLARFRAAGAAACALEASSHGLDQARLSGLQLAAAGFTNLGYDHGDYHPDRTAYAAAKRRLFEHRPLGAAVFNIDDQHGRQMAAEFADELPVWTCSVDGRHDARIRATRVRSEPDATLLVLHVDDIEREINLPLIGRFNVSNALIALGMLIATGHTVEAACAALETVSAPPGRMERCGVTPSGAAIFVDYAHSPDSLAAALTALRELTAGQLCVVFGCGGERDRDKRPEMGRVAANLADRVVVTADNPRREDAAVIAQAILRGIDDRDAVVVELDRGQAIRRGVATANRGDIVLIAGKGHETQQLVGTRAEPFDDRARVAASIAELAS